MKSVILFLLGALVALSFGVNIIQYTKTAELKQESISLSRANASLKAEVGELKSDVSDYKDEVEQLTAERDYFYEYWYNNSDKVDLLDTSIVFIEDDGSYLYHRYECRGFLGESWWAHNIEYANYLGFDPCPLCCD